MRVAPANSYASSNESRSCVIWNGCGRYVARGTPGMAGADPFEAWADLAAHYPLDPGHALLTGSSMGGYGVVFRQS